MSDSCKGKSFKDFEENEIDLNDRQSSLGDWYLSVRDTPVVNLPDGDLARSCRQKIFIQKTIPVVLDRLAGDPSLGHLYDFELVCSLRNIPESYWLEHPEDAGKLVLVLKNIDVYGLDDDVKGDLDAIESCLNERF